MPYNPQTGRDTLKARLRIRAISHGRSMEEEARQIVKSKLMAKPKHGSNLAEAFRFHIAPVGGALKPSPSGTLFRSPGRPAVPCTFITTITRAEVLPAGKRGHAYTCRRLFAEDLEGRPISQLAIIAFPKSSVAHRGAGSLQCNVVS